MIVANNAARINIWPTHAHALVSAESGGKPLGRLTVWPTRVSALAHRTLADALLTETGGFFRTESGDRIILE